MFGKTKGCSIFLKKCPVQQKDVVEIKYEEAEMNFAKQEVTSLRTQSARKFDP